MYELKPCPFCGEEEYCESGETKGTQAFFDGTIRDNDYGFVKCHCGAMVYADSEPEAVQIWNNRVTK